MLADNCNCERLWLNAIRLDDDDHDDDNNDDDDDDDVDDVDFQFIS